jgi:hypothetical protein
MVSQEEPPLQALSMQENQETQETEEEKDEQTPQDMM